MLPPTLPPLTSLTCKLKKEFCSTCDETKPGWITYLPWWKTNQLCAKELCTDVRKLSSAIIFFFPWGTLKLDSYTRPTITLSTASSQQWMVPEALLTKAKCRQQASEGYVVYTRDTSCIMFLPNTDFQRRKPWNLPLADKRTTNTMTPIFASETSQKTFIQV